MSKKKLKNARHPMEIPLTIISILFTLAFYSIVSTLCIKAATDQESLNKLMEILETDSSVAEWLIKLGSWGVVIVLIYIVLYLIYIDKVFIGKTSTNSTRLIDSKYRDINDTFIEYCKKLDIKKIPLVYIETNYTNSSFLGIKIRSDNAVGIDSRELRDAERENNYDRVKYILARRISHIYLRHNNLFIIVFAFVGKLIPIFNNLYERTMCYSTDKVVEYLLGEEITLRGIYYTFYSDEMYESDTDFYKMVKDKIRTENSSESVGRFLENLLADDPLPIYRLDALLGKGKSGRLF